MADRRRTALAALQVQAPNGVMWTRVPGGSSAPADLLRELADFTKSHTEREWDWWQEGRRDLEHDRQWAILREWHNGAPEPEKRGDPEAAAKTYLDELDRQHEVERQHRAEHAAKWYDQERERLRLALMGAEADAAFFAHVLQAPASPAQQENAERRIAERRQAAQELRSKLGDPEQIIDCNGYLPAERRSMNLSSHMTLWRHPTLRELHNANQRKRFNALLAMRPPEPASMCSECQAPSQWHEYALSPLLVPLQTTGRIDGGNDGGPHARMVGPVHGVHDLPVGAPGGWTSRPSRLRRRAVAGHAAIHVEADLRAGPA